MDKEFAKSSLTLSVWFRSGSVHVRLVTVGVGVLRPADDQTGRTNLQKQGPGGIDSAPFHKLLPLQSNGSGGVSPLTGQLFPWLNYSV